MWKRNILNKKDKEKYHLSFKRILIGISILALLIFVIMFFNGAVIHRGG